MPDKKLTDNEIIKALEWYVSKFKTVGFVYMDADGTHLIGTQDVLDLINRLQAENERLKEENKILDLNRRMALLEKEPLYDKIKTAKAEAYKEVLNKVRILRNQSLINKAAANRIEKILIETAGE